MKRTTGRLAALIAAGALLLTACGTDSSTGAQESGSSARAETITIDHTYGQTRITGTPQRVVTVVGPSWSDALIKLGVPITGEFVSAGYSGAGNRFEWTPEHQSTVATVSADTGVPSSEQVAALRPDVILAGYLPNQAAYDALSKIAPTVPVLTKGAVMDDWQIVTRTAGRIFGKESQANAAVSETEKLLTDTKAKYPAAQGKTFAFGQLAANKQFGVVTSPTDPASKLLASVGLTLAPAVQELDKNGQRAIVSPERIDVLRADLLIFWPLVGGPETFESIAGWSGLPAVQSGATVYLANDNASGFGAPTIYSVPWAVNKLTPALEKLRS